MALASLFSTYVDGGNLYIWNSGTAQDTFIDGGFVDLKVGASATGGITFSGGNGGILQIDGAAMPAATISGWAAGDEIVLTGVAYSADGSRTLAAGNVLQIEEWRA